jgi:multicomponent Na+:H+ antiporter subunit C
MDWIEFAIGRYNYWIFITLMMIGLFIVIARGNLIKKLIGLNVFQTSVFIYYISIGKIAGGTAPIYLPQDLAARVAHPAPAVGHEGLANEPESVHAAPAGNALDALTEAPGSSVPAAPIHAAPGGAANEGLTGAAPQAIDQAAVAGAALADVIYSNPLPHVLILTAIVVGVATTAVGLALVIRIREAYGTIEEDELEATDDIAEFGAPPGGAAELHA